jgi:hypothetical protein
VHNDLLFLIVVIVEHIVFVRFLAREIPPRHGSSGACLRGCLRTGMCKFDE